MSHQKWLCSYCPHLSVHHPQGEQHLEGGCVWGQSSWLAQDPGLDMPPVTRPLQLQPGGDISVRRKQFRISQGDQMDLQHWQGQKWIKTSSRPCQQRGNNKFENECEWLTWARPHTPAPPWATGGHTVSVGGAGGGQEVGGAGGNGRHNEEHREHQRETAYSHCHLEVKISICQC